MDIKAAFPSDYLRSVDIKGRKVRVIIDRVEIEQIGNDHKPVVYFQGKEKGVVLNKTNSMSLAALFGSETDDWTGGHVEITTAPVFFQGKMVDGIRLNPLPSPGPAATPAPAPQRAAPVAAPMPASTPLAPGHALDDDIPFGPSC